MRKPHNARLPSIRALKAFRAAVQTGNFTSAAKVLNVTQGAISRQIQELEHLLGVTLFTRNGPKLSLTSQGRSFFKDADICLEALENSVRNLAPKTSDSLTLGMLPSVATRWLSPRLGRFLSAYPDINLKISVFRVQDLDLTESGIDAAVRYNRNEWSGVNAELLGRETISPVCSPEFLKSNKIVEPKDLLSQTLFHSGLEETWEKWFAAVGLTDIELTQGALIGDAAALLQAAVEGQGVVLGRSVLVADDLSSGRLVRPFDIHLEATRSYWFVVPENTEIAGEIKILRDWISDEFAERTAGILKSS